MAGMMLPEGHGDRDDRDVGAGGRPGRRARVRRSLRGTHALRARRGRPRMARRPRDRGRRDARSGRVSAVVVAHTHGRIRADLWITQVDDDAFVVVQAKDEPEPVEDLLRPYVLSSAVRLDDTTGILRVLVFPGRDGDASRSRGTIATRGSGRRSTRASVLVDEPLLRTLAREPRRPAHGGRLRGGRAARRGRAGAPDRHPEGMLPGPGVRGEGAEPRSSPDDPSPPAVRAARRVRHPRARGRRGGRARHERGAGPGRRERRSSRRWSGAPSTPHSRRRTRRRCSPCRTSPFGSFPVSRLGVLTSTAFDPFRWEPPLCYESGASEVHRLGGPAEGGVC